MFEVNQVFIHPFLFSQNEVNRFAEITGDNNPIHINLEYAAKTGFKRPIIHGMLGAAIFSKVFGTLFPGEGTIYLKQSLNFLRPIYTNTNYEAIFTIKEINNEKSSAVVETVIKNTDGKICTTGEATIINYEKIKK